jgi:hypothetical protein
VKPANHMLERITAILKQARSAGGWVDEDVARAVLAELGLDEDGEPIDREPTSPNLGHG